MKLGPLTRVVFALSAALFTVMPAAHAAENSAPPAPHAAAQRHDLRGVVVAIDTDKSALRVRHEKIPGVMAAMTMQFRVDSATLKAVKIGDAITARMSRQGDHWLLEEVKPAPAPSKK